MARLTGKMKLFCEIYVSNDMNGTQAAIDAGYKKNSAAEIASENLRKPHIKEYVRELQLETGQKLQITRESLIKDLDWVKDAAKGNFELSPLIKAIEVQARMLGLNEPDTLNVNQYTASVEFADR